MISSSLTVRLNWKFDRWYKSLVLIQEPVDYGPTMLPLHTPLAKAVSTPLATHFKLSSRHSPSNEAEKTNMNKVLYASIVVRMSYPAYWMVHRTDVPSGRTTRPTGWSIRPAG
ncbi:hypothetical protein CR513_36510, partial [Mucuna pruriens]